MAITQNAEYIKIEGGKTYNNCTLVIADGMVSIETEDKPVGQVDTMDYMYPIIKILEIKLRPSRPDRKEVK
uniref:Uncharacterized protein n=1 Tax=viral metagenome TaxID=1070528 RepID=A0A6M3IDK1_9ZZZZ